MIHLLNDILCNVDAEMITYAHEVVNAIPSYVPRFGPWRRLVRFLFFVHNGTVSLGPHWIGSAACAPGTLNLQVRATRWHG